MGIFRASQEDKFHSTPVYKNNIYEPKSVSSSGEVYTHYIDRDYNFPSSPWVYVVQKYCLYI